MSDDAKQIAAEIDRTAPHGTPEQDDGRPPWPTDATTSAEYRDQVMAYLHYRPAPAPPSAPDTKGCFLICETSKGLRSGELAVEIRCLKEGDHVHLGLPLEMLEKAGDGECEKCSDCGAGHVCDTCDLKPTTPAPGSLQRARDALDRLRKEPTELARIECLVVAVRAILNIIEKETK